MVQASRSKKAAWIVLLLIAFSARGQAERLTVESLFRPYAYSQMRISPGGKFLGVVVRSVSSQYLLTVDIATRREAIACSGEILQYDWITDDRLVVEAGGGLYGGMVAVDRNGANLKVVVPTLSSQASEGWSRYYRAYRVLENSGND
jgi:hypothetical protein